MTKSESYNWEFKPRFKRNAFGWKSEPAATRIKEAVREIKKVARKDSALAGEGAVIFLERLSPALARIDSSSGYIGNTVYSALHELVPIIARADVSQTKREAWLDRLWQARIEDKISYIENLDEFWGELCASKELAGKWVDNLIDTVKLAWSTTPRSYFHGTTACLSAFYYTERFDELFELLKLNTSFNWSYQVWGVKAYAAMGKTDEAINYANSCHDRSINCLGFENVCEEILLAAGATDQAYSKFAIAANQGSSNLNTFRAITKKYPHKNKSDILVDLIASTPGEEGKWFAAAKEAGLLELALRLACESPCDPRTLTRAANDYTSSDPQFALNCGLAALYWLIEGYGYEITSADVISVYAVSIKIAEALGTEDDVCKRLCNHLATKPSTNFVRKIIGGYVGITA
jgi:hypothetical protein